MDKVFGITGGFGVGKSEFCKMLERLGGIWIDTDIIIKDLYMPGEAGFMKVKGYFGDEFVDLKHGVKREKLRRVVLKTPAKLWILNKLVHPLVVNEVNKKVVQLKKSGSNPIFIEAFYFEKNDLAKLVNGIVLIERDPENIKKSRIAKSKWNDEEIRRFMKLRPQYPIPIRIIRNNGKKRELFEEAKGLYDTII